MMSRDGQPGDLRVRRTRQAIEKAFLELLAERDFQAITVQDIADRAMVNRATFYDHFTDKYVLFEHSVRGMMQQTLEKKVPVNFPYGSNSIQAVIVIVCEVVAQIDDTCRHKTVKGMPNFDEQVVELVSELFLNWFEDNKGENLGASPALSADVASWAIYGAARHWSAQKLRKSVEDFAVRVAPMISALLEQREIVASP